MSISLDLQNVTFRYTGINGSDRMVIHNVSLRLGKKECVAIVGPSGSGKTTLIQHFTGLLRPLSGKILVDGQDIWHRSFSQDGLRRRIGLVFQFPENQLFEETVAKDVAFGPRNLGLSDNEIDRRISAAMEAVYLDRKVFDPRSPFRLSEGEKRRAAIAGVLAMDPELVVFDEPTAGLDPKGTERMSSIIKGLRASGKSVAVISHNIDFVAQIAERVIIMLNGEIAYDGLSKSLFANEALLKSAGLQVPSLIAVLKEMKHLLPTRFASAVSFEDLLTQLSPSSSPSAQH